MVGNPWPALAILVLVRTGMGLQFQSVAAVGPALVAEFRLDYAALGSLVGAYLLPGVAVALPGGWLGARLGDLRLVRAGLALMALGGAASALAHGFPLLLAGRLAAGAGAALLNVFLAKMTTDLFAGRSLVVAMGWLLSAWPAGIGLALLTLGWVGAALSWRAALGATAAVALLGLALMAAYPTPRTEVGTAGRLAHPGSRRPSWRPCSRSGRCGRCSTPPWSSCSPSPRRTSSTAASRRPWRGRPPACCRGR